MIKSLPEFRNIELIHFITRGDFFQIRIVYHLYCFTHTSTIYTIDNIPCNSSLIFSYLSSRKKSINLKPSIVSTVAKFSTVT